VTVYSPEPRPAAIEELRIGGVDRVVLTLSQDSRDAAMEDLDSYQSLL
jgi:hypothetical protein